MAIADDFRFFHWGMYMYMYSEYTIFFKLHHTGTRFLMGNVDLLFDPIIRQLHSQGGQALQRPIFFRCFNVTHEKQSVCGR